ncbi:MAG: benzoate 1,2-dioxygenase small subunit [Candidatus Sphingomonas colombiensis]|nr:benzoate 1,2-dioxygenase small subunit [Sphingomonas sp.]WEK41992.1 MAG: benzoate 1,2-dioxygenase small subunit [Sphingomonas sp.]
MSSDYQAICAFLYREARLIDDRQWDEWLECYAPGAEFWMPAWTDDDELVEDPHREISLIYYPDRQGLEDRVFRIRTERSSATMPEPRTNHAINNVEILDAPGDTVEVRFNWNTLAHRNQATHQFFGTSFYSLDVSGEAPKILRKKVVLKNDYIHQVIDIYHI